MILKSKITQQSRKFQLALSDPTKSQGSIKVENNADYFINIVTKK